MATKRRRAPLMRFRRDDPEHNLLAATQRFVRARGGEVVVIGPAVIVHESPDPYRFILGVHCMGKAPERAPRESHLPSLDPEAIIKAGSGRQPHVDVVSPAAKRAFDRAKAAT